jgi:succinate dehydrogenase/fumarate reductase flavoprotein subunit
MKPKTTRATVLVIGSGAAGLNAALQLHRQGVEDVVIVTEGLQHGTSINTGSDKQTYYKLSLCGDEVDSPVGMAQTYLSGGGMHGDLALVESALSVRAFMNLVALGVPFPHDAYGQYVGYKTDHDPLQRATSIGPYTSQVMCRTLQKAAIEAGVAIREGCEAISLLVDERSTQARVIGALFLNDKGDYEVVLSDFVVFAVGGPGGLYRDSVYPAGHTGAIGLALLAGAKARNLSESQFGLAATHFRWNVSGSYLQVIPRVYSLDEHGVEREFLLEAFTSPDECYSTLFLKGYQWPFDAEKVIGGSSLIDLLVYQETVILGRQVFLDYRQNPEGFLFDDLSEEVRNYLRESGALQETPIERLQRMNPQAIALFKQQGIDLAQEPLKIAVCAQHNNGGLAGDLWWQSENITGLYPIGEVNGSHGAKRPGGSALNAGQVGGIRAAQHIAYCLKNRQTPPDLDERCLDPQVDGLIHWAEKGQSNGRPWQKVLAEIQQRMSEIGGFIRQEVLLDEAVAAAWQLWDRVNGEGLSFGEGERKQAYLVRHLCFAHAAYLDATRFNVASGVGSRGSSLVLGEEGAYIHDKLPNNWLMIPEDTGYRNKVLETVYRDGQLMHTWVDCRPLPTPSHWFERDWAACERGDIFSA